jgi:hypothetical protein
MEFLMTYGWAILIAIIAIAALIAFGVLNPGKSSGNTCGTANALMPNLGCKEMKATTAGGLLNISVQNGLGGNLTAITFAVDGCTADGPVNWIEDGTWRKYDFHGCTCTNGRLKSKIDFTYTLEGESFPHTLSDVPLNVRCE